MICIVCPFSLTPIVVVKEGGVTSLGLSSPSNASRTIFSTARQSYTLASVRKAERRGIEIAVEHSNASSTRDCSATLTGHHICPSTIEAKNMKNEYFGALVPLIELMRCGCLEASSFSQSNIGYI